MCRLLGVKRNGFYRYLKAQNQPKPEVDRRAEIIEWMYKIAKETEYSYGSRRMRKALNCLGYPVGRRYVRRLMKEADIQVRYKKKYKVTTNSNHKLPVFDTHHYFFLELRYPLNLSIFRFILFEYKIFLAFRILIMGIRHTVK